MLLQGFDLRSGKPVDIDNPLAGKDAMGGGYATDGEFWVLSNVPSGDADADETTYDTWAWHHSWKEPKKVMSLAGPAYVSDIRPLHDGLLGVTLQMQGPYVIDLRTGTAQRLRTDWATVMASNRAVTLDWGEGREGRHVAATVPVDHRAPQPKECTGSPLNG